jgi:hypothetical protein
LGGDVGEGHEIGIKLLLSYVKELELESISIYIIIIKNN